MSSEKLLAAPTFPPGVNTPPEPAAPEAKTVVHRTITTVEIGQMLDQNHRQIISLFASQSGQIREILSSQNTLSGVIDELAQKMNTLSERVESVEKQLEKQTDRSGELMTEVSGLKVRVVALEEARKADPVAVLRVPAWIVAVAVAAPQALHLAQEILKLFHG